ncbi:MAG TPA: tRNA (guanosine(46)-N7)-methyltransferase TrmB [Candidatus Onthovivens sp.]|nr:tRNA (guanosine(46)-N7)-methyltransferase TrmB [Candidatus Onthovivens sp.]
MRVTYKAWAVEYLKESNLNQLKIEEANEDINNFIREKDTFLEIGPGKGKFIISLATKFPDYNFLVVELNATISGIALKKIDESGLKNIKIICGDFYKLVDVIEPNSLQGIFLNFSDPWPKKRHAKRRLTSPLFLENYIKILKNDHYIYFKSDNEGLYQYTLEIFNEFKLNIIENNPDYNELAKLDALSEYEEKFRNQGTKIKRIVVKIKGDETNE